MINYLKNSNTLFHQNEELFISGEMHDISIGEVFEMKSSIATNGVDGLFLEYEKLENDILITKFFQEVGYKSYVKKCRESSSSDEVKKFYVNQGYSEVTLDLILNTIPSNNTQIISNSPELLNRLLAYREYLLARINVHEDLDSLSEYVKKQEQESKEFKIYEREAININFGRFVMYSSFIYLNHSLGLPIFCSEELIKKEVVKAKNDIKYYKLLLEADIDVLFSSILEAKSQKEQFQNLAKMGFSESNIEDILNRKDCRIIESESYFKFIIGNLSAYLDLLAQIIKQTFSVSD